MCHLCLQHDLKVDEKLGDLYLVLADVYTAFVVKPKPS